MMYGTYELEKVKKDHRELQCSLFEYYDIRKRCILEFLAICIKVSQKILWSNSFRNVNCYHKATKFFPLQIEIHVNGHERS